MRKEIGLLDDENNEAIKRKHYRRIVRISSKKGETKVIQLWLK